MTRRQRRTFTPEFKLQLVKLCESGKSRTDIAKEYDITPSALDRWVNDHHKTGSFTAEDSRSKEETELIKLRKEDQKNSIEIARIFKESRHNYGTRKIKVELAKLPFKKQISRRRIGLIMHQLGLVSNYTIAQFKPYKSTCNEASIKNELD